MTESGLSVLRRKIECANSLPKEIARLLPLWRLFGEKCGPHLSGKPPLLLVLEKIEQEAVTLSTLIDSRQDTALIFPILSKTDDPIGVIQLPEATGLPLALNALGQPDIPDEYPKPNIYDLFILKPLLALMLTDLSSCLSVKNDLSFFLPISPAEPILQCKDMKRLKLPESLLQVHFTLNDTDANQSREFLLFLSMDAATNLARKMPETSEVADVDEETVEKLRSFLLETTIPITAELDRFNMSVGECCRLNVGDILPLPDTSLDRVQIKARTVEADALLSTGHLGIIRQQKSVKLQNSISEEFFGSIEILHSSAH